VQTVIKSNTRLKGALLATLMLVFSFSTWADEWSLKDAGGVRYTLSGLHGKWVLVNFWAPWCPSCIQEMPKLGVAVMYKNRKEVLDMVKSMAIFYPVVMGNEDTASDFGGMVGLPTSFLYSPFGKLVSRYEGSLTENEVEQVMAQK
jgi:thiol-disulfide isomerase/thioredoxin